jgi:hypothetical protein
MGRTTYMVIERYKNKDPKPVYRRFREKGRMAPDSLNYISSWISEDVTVCYQIMETNNPALLDEWMNNWKDIVAFEVFPVINSQEALEKVAPFL